MKKLLLVCTFSISLSGFSQIWQNDFSNPTDWISADLNAGTDSWIISSTAIGGEVDSISSSSAANGFAQFNSEGQCGGNHQDVTLTYFQPIDISTNQLSYLQFVQHYKRKSDTVYVEFSNDGLTWESIRINKNYWYYQQTDDPDTVQVSIPATIQSQPFYLRFRFQGECGFAWLMDDLMIFEKEQYSAKIESKILINGTEYSKVNHCVMDTLDYNFTIENFGYDTLTDITVLTDIYQDGIYQSTQIDTIIRLYPLQILDTLFFDIESTFGLSTDDYSFVTNVFSADLDTLILNKDLDLTLTALRTDVSGIQGEYLTDSEVWGLGQTFVATEDYCSGNSYLYVPADVIDNTLVFLIWYKLENGIWLYNGMSPDYPIYYTGVANWIGITTYFDDVFHEGDTGLAVISTYSQEFPITYSQRTGSENIYSLDYMFNLTLEPEGHSILLELNTNYLQRCNCFLELEETNKPTLIIYPNPTTSEIQIQNLTEPISSLKIISIDGREMYFEKNPQSEKVTVSFLENGTYLIFVETNDGTIYSEKFVKL